jgi:RND family efflux transporter MFP subunit
MKTHRFLALCALPLLLLACGQPAARAPKAQAANESWSVTAWGERFEIFAEVGALVGGQPAVASVHVTRLDDFSAVTEGSASVVLSAEGAPARFTASAPVRPGIFRVEMQPEGQGEYRLSFVVEANGQSEEIHGGRVRVGSAADPGSLLADAPGSAPAPAPATFLKEQQWHTTFATAPVASGALRRSVKGPGRVTAAAGGDVVLTAAVGGLVAAPRWPFTGMEVPAGSVLFTLTPPLSQERSLAVIQGEVASLRAELEAATARRARLEQLLATGATSRRQVEEVHALVSSLEARLAATDRDLETATAARRGRAGGETSDVVSPIAGRVASVEVSPGQSVAAGTALARVVRTRPVWVEVALAPGDAMRVVADPAGMIVRAAADEPARLVPAGRVRLVSRSPEVDAATGAATVIVEVDHDADDLLLGRSLETELLLAGEVGGIVVPNSASVDDSGTPIAYVQLSGEGFARRELKVLMRQGADALVEGLAVGERLVTQGGSAIRRAEMLSTGSVEGHVH